MQTVLKELKPIVQDILAGGDDVLTADPGTRTIFVRHEGFRRELALMAIKELTKGADSSLSVHWAVESEARFHESVVRQFVDRGAKAGVSLHLALRASDKDPKTDASFSDIESLFVWNYAWEAHKMGSPTDVVILDEAHGASFVPDGFEETTYVEDALAHAKVAIVLIESGTSLKVEIPVAAEIDATQYRSNEWIAHQAQIAAREAYERSWRGRRDRFLSRLRSKLDPRRHIRNAARRFCGCDCPCCYREA